MFKQTTSSLHNAHTKGSFSRLLFESEHSNGSGDSNRSITFRACQCLVVVMRLVTPFSYVFMFSVWALNISSQNLTGINKILYLMLYMWMLAEVIFLPYYYYLFTTLSSRNEELEHLATDRKGRFDLVS